MRKEEGGRDNKMELCLISLWIFSVWKTGCPVNCQSCREVNLFCQLFINSMQHLVNKEKKFSHLFTVGKCTKVIVAPLNCTSLFVAQQLLSSAAVPLYEDELNIHSYALSKLLGKKTLSNHFKLLNLLFFSLTMCLMDCSNRLFRVTISV